VPEPLDPQCIFDVLERNEVAYVLIGGLAAVIHGSTAMTNDADIFPAPDRDNLARLAAALRDLDARVRSPETPDGLPFDPHPDLLSGLAVLNLTTRCGDLDVALEPAGLGTFSAVRTAAVDFDLGRARVAVAALEDIIRSKEAADRPKDRATLPLLYALEEEIARRHDDESPSAQSVGSPDDR
jgi:hypothetical protein